MRDYKQQQAEEMVMLLEAMFQSVILEERAWDKKKSGEANQHHQNKCLCANKLAVSITRSLGGQFHIEESML